MALHANQDTAGQHARAVLQVMLAPPPAVVYPGIPFVFTPPSAIADSTGGVTSTDVLLLSSLYPRRRATLALLPHDVNDGSRNWNMTDEQRALFHSGGYVPFHQPYPLPPPPHHREKNDDDGSSSSNKDHNSAAKKGKGDGDVAAAAVLACPVHPVLALCRTIPRTPTSPYHQLSYIFDCQCCPFTALFATLRAAGFTRVEGRDALLHTTHSLLWVKRLTASLVDGLLRQLPHYRKVNHFPGAHWLGRKDKLCLLLRRAGQRWEERSSEGETAQQCGPSARGEWDDLTPPTWLLPQDAQAFGTALRSTTSTTATTAPERHLFIVKPANNAGGQGIFLLDAGPGAGGAGAAEAALRKVGALPATGIAKALTSAKTCLSEGIACWTSKDFTEAGAAARSSAADSSCFVVQRYLSNPVLILGHKFDLRLYVVVTSYEPVRVYLYREGLVRIASASYRTTDDGAGPLADLEQLKAHLTNFTVNKVSGTASEDDEGQAGEGFDSEKYNTAARPNAMEPKWSLEALGVYLQDVGYDWAGTQARINELLRRAFLAVTPEVRAELRAAARRVAAGDDAAAAAPTAPPPGTAHGIGPFFQFFGVDVLLVHDAVPAADAASTAATLRPVLLEVNILPSLSTHYSVFDQRVKANFIADALTLVGLTSPLFKATPPRQLVHSAAEGNSAEAADWIAQTFPDDVAAQEACMTAAEEQRRSGNFTPLLPTADSAVRYASLMVDEALGVTTQSRYDAVLSAWAGASLPSVE